MIFRLALAFSLLPALLAAETLRLAVTTSFENSGLADVLLPAIEADTGITLELLVVGTGQALRLGEAGDVDAILVHSRRAEDRFVADGHGAARLPFMFNDFVLIGPASDPAGIAEARSAAEALAQIAAHEAPFVSRGDDSGTHRKETTLWPNGVPDDASWYREAGSGMGATLNVAAGLSAYVLSDRATWLTFGNKGDLVILFEGDPELFNQYSFIAVNPAAHPHVNADATTRLGTWLTSEAAARLIGDYTLEGEQLFTWNADVAEN